MAEPATTTTIPLLFVGDAEVYENYMGYGLFVMRARDASTNYEDGSTGRGRWQHAIRISASIFGAQRALP